MGTKSFLPQRQQQARDQNVHHSLRWYELEAQHLKRVKNGSKRTAAYVGRLCVCYIVSMTQAMIQRVVVLVKCVVLEVCRSCRFTGTSGSRA